VRRPQAASRRSKKSSANTLSLSSRKRIGESKASEARQDFSSFSRVRCGVGCRNWASSGIRISSGLIQLAIQQSPATMRGGHGISWRHTSWPRRVENFPRRYVRRVSVAVSGSNVVFGRLSKLRLRMSYRGRNSIRFRRLRRLAVCVNLDPLRDGRIASESFTRSRRQMLPRQVSSVAWQMRMNAI
jgi:hypothetical protein